MKLTRKEKQAIEKLQADHPGTIFDLMVENHKLKEGLAHVLNLMENNDLDHAHAALQLMVDTPMTSKAWDHALKMGDTIDGP